MRWLDGIYILPTLLVLVLSVCFWQGMRGTDDLGYSQTAVSLLPGSHFSSTHPSTYHDARIAIIFPLAGAFLIFGIRDFSLSLLPLVATVLTAPLVVRLACHLWGRAAGWTAGFLYAFFPLTINLSSFCVPEPLFIFELCLASVLLLSAIDGQDRGAAFKEFLAGLLVGVGYLTTEVSLLVLPVFGLYLFFQRRLRFRNVWLLAGFMVVFCSELTYYSAVHGNPLYHFTMTSGLPDDPAILDANSNLPYRLLKTYPNMFVRPNVDFGILGPLLILGGLYGLVMWRECSFFVIWSAAILLFYNFMSASLKHYLALPAASRLIAPGCVALLILSAKLIVDLWNWASSRIKVIFLRLLCGVCALGTVLASLLFMYLAKTPDFTGIVARNAKAAAEFLKKEPSVVIVSDSRSAEAIQFDRKFNPTDSYLGFETASRLLQSATGVIEQKPIFIVFSGPVIYEKEIKGQFYGGSLSLVAGDRQDLQLFSQSSTDVFSEHVRMDALLKALLRQPTVRGVLGSSGARLAQVFVSGDPRLIQVQVMRYDPRLKAGESLP